MFIKSHITSLYNLTTPMFALLAIWQGCHPYLSVFSLRWPQVVTIVVINKKNECKAMFVCTYIRFVESYNNMENWKNLF